jgi:CspA family cold shock protein
MREPQLAPKLLEDLMPTLGALASLVRKESVIDDESLRILAMGSGSDEPAVQISIGSELRRWANILESIRGINDAMRRDAAVHSLKLRGVNEASAILAVADVMGALDVAEDGDIPELEPQRRILGTVKKFENGWGFITPDDGGSDVFVHWTGIEGRGFKALKPGAKVAFQIEETEKGPKAVSVREVFTP